MDLIASVHDGRLSKEVRQIGPLAVAMVVIEGPVGWTAQGNYTGRSRWTKAQHFGLLWSLQRHGFWVVGTSTLTDTAEMLMLFEKWSSGDHRGLEHRPGPSPSEWGTIGSHEWANWLLQGFEGVGPKVADSILATFDKVPLMWECTQDDLEQVPGIGPLRARKLVESLGSLS